MSEKQLQQFRESIARVRQANGDTPEHARRFLQDEGVLTASGELAEVYRSEESQS